jgi:cytochrome c-type biogenesis protein CcmF
MLKFFGTLCLWSALGFALVQSILPMLGHFRRRQHLLATARPAALGQFFCVMAAYGLLTIAFVTSDFSIAYVGMNSHPLLPFMYRLTAVWGGHEGSILLWIVLINAWTVVFATLQKKSVLMPLTTAVLGIINLCFLLFLIFTSNPFLPALQLLTGSDLNPLLQDPGFVIHPPMLYAGYVGFAVTFAITQAALIRGELNTEWAALTRRYALAAWCFLTFGIMLGSWWAYRVLGWGGFWFWDPVENASLLPWLAGTALIHVLLISEKRDAAIGWSALLALITFTLSLLGTFLVRSGVLISAHTFANDPSRGLFLLLLLAFILTASLAIYLARWKIMAAERGAPFQLLSRETGLLINSGLLIIAMLTILLGTIYPLIIDALHMDAISVGAPYFNMVMAPLVFVLMFFMGIGPLCQWQQQGGRALLKIMSKQALLSIAAAIALLWGMTGSLEFSAVMSLALSLWIVLSVIGSYRVKPGMVCAHLGFAMLIIGILLSSLLSQEREVRLKPGNAVSIGPYQFFFIGTKGITGSNYRGIQAEFDVMKNDRHVTNMYPEKRIYLVRDMVMTKVDIHPGVFRDLYLALGEPLDDTSWSIRVYYKPFIRWIWAGSIVMIIGGILSLIGYKSGRRST